jgi:hypothetical protein
MQVNKSELSGNVQEYFKQFDDFNNADNDTTNSK